MTTTTTTTTKTFHTAHVHVLPVESTGDEGDIKRINTRKPSSGGAEPRQWQHPARQRVIEEHKATIGGKISADLAIVRRSTIAVNEAEKISFLNAHLGNLPEVWGTLAIPSRLECT